MKWTDRRFGINKLSFLLFPVAFTKASLRLGISIGTIRCDWLAPES